YLIDKFIISFVAIVILLPLLAFIGWGIFTSPDFEPSFEYIVALVSAYIGAICLIFIGQWLYFAILESTKGATLGKMALGIVVTDMRGNRISFGRASGRYFAKIISSLLL